MTIRAILCPVDLSPVSGPVLRAALALAQRESARVTVVHVLEPLLAQASAMTYDTPVLETMVAEELETLVLRTAEAAGVPFDTITRRVRLAEPDTGIVEAADEIDADLIVMGTHGFSGLRKLFFGSTASRVIARATRPVLALPPHAIDTTASAGSGTPFAIARVIAAVDFSESSMVALQQAIALARRWHLPLTLLHIVEPAPGLARWNELLDEHQSRRIERARHQLDLIARDIADVPVTVASVSGTAEEGIAVVADRQPGSIVVLGLRRGEGGRDAFRLGSTAYRLLCVTTQPVLMVPMPAPDQAARPARGGR